MVELNSAMVLNDAASAPLRLSKSGDTALNNTQAVVAFDASSGAGRTCVGMARMLKRRILKQANLAEPVRPKACEIAHRLIPTTTPRP